MLLLPAFAAAGYLGVKPSVFLRVVLALGIAIVAALVAMLVGWFVWWVISAAMAAPAPVS